MWTQILAVAFYAFFAADLAVAGSVASSVSYTDVSSIVGNPKLKSKNGQNLQVIRVLIDQRVDRSKPAIPDLKIYVQGGLHGNEVLSTHFVAWLGKRLIDGDSGINELPINTIAIDMMPAANPDGRDQLSRLNGNGVNLNRNFGVLWGLSRENPGTASFSEPETQAIKALMEHQRYDVAVDVHGYVNWIVAPSQPKQIKNPSAFAQLNYQNWFEALRTELAKLSRYELRTANDLGDGGAFEDWAFWQNRTLAFCLEMKSRDRYETSSRAFFGFEDSFKSYENFVTQMIARAAKMKQTNNQLIVIQ